NNVFFLNFPIWEFLIETKDDLIFNGFSHKTLFKMDQNKTDILFKNKGPCQEGSCHLFCIVMGLSVPHESDAFFKVSGISFRNTDFISHSSLKRKGAISGPLKKMNIRLCL